MKRFELNEEKVVEQPKLKRSLFSRLKRKFKKTAVPVPLLTSEPVVETPKPLEKPKTQLKISEEAVKVKPQPVVSQPVVTQPKKRDWRVAINMVVGGCALMVLVYGAIILNQAFTPNITIVTSILMVTIGASILIATTRGI
jgi:hypothetical protein